MVNGGLCGNSGGHCWGATPKIYQQMAPQLELLIVQELLMGGATVPANAEMPGLASIVMEARKNGKFLHSKDVHFKGLTLVFQENETLKIHFRNTKC